MFPKLSKFFARLHHGNQCEIERIVGDESEPHSTKAEALERCISSSTKFTPQLKSQLLNFDVGAADTRKKMRRKTQRAAPAVLTRNRTAVRGCTDAQRLEIIHRVKKIRNQEGFNDRFIRDLKAVHSISKAAEVVDRCCAEAYNPTDPDHEARLDLLWRLLMAHPRRGGRITPEWELIGFQGSDPATDFRGVGLLGLNNLIALAHAYPYLTQKMLLEARGNPPEKFTGIENNGNGRQQQGGGVRLASMPSTILEEAGALGEHSSEGSAGAPREGEGLRAGSTNHVPSPAAAAAATGLFTGGDDSPENGGPVRQSPVSSCSRASCGSVWTEHDNTMRTPLECALQGGASGGAVGGGTQGSGARPHSRRPFLEAAGARWRSGAAKASEDPSRWPSPSSSSMRGGGMGMGLGDGEGEGSMGAARGERQQGSADTLDDDLGLPDHWESDDGGRGEDEEEDVLPGVLQTRILGHSSDAGEGGPRDGVEGRTQLSHIADAVSPTGVPIVSASARASAESNHAPSWSVNMAAAASGSPPRAYLEVSEEWQKSQQSASANWGGKEKEKERERDPGGVVEEIVSVPVNGNSPTSPPSDGAGGLPADFFFSAMSPVETKRAMRLHAPPPLPCPTGVPPSISVSTPGGGALVSAVSSVPPGPDEIPSFSPPPSPLEAEASSAGADRGDRSAPHRSQPPPTCVTSSSIVPSPHGAGGRVRRRPSDTSSVSQSMSGFGLRVAPGNRRRSASIVSLVFAKGPLDHIGPREAGLARMQRGRGSMQDLVAPPGGVFWEPPTGVTWGWYSWALTGLNITGWLRSWVVNRQPHVKRLIYGLKEDGEILRALQSLYALTFALFHLFWVEEYRPKTILEFSNAAKVFQDKFFSNHIQPQADKNAGLPTAASAPAQVGGASSREGGDMPSPGACSSCKPSECLRCDGDGGDFDDAALWRIPSTLKDVEARVAAMEMEGKRRWNELQQQAATAAMAAANGADGVLRDTSPMSGGRGQGSR